MVVKTFSNEASIKASLERLSRFFERGDGCDLDERTLKKIEANLIHMESIAYIYRNQSRKTTS